MKQLLQADHINTSNCCPIKKRQVFTVKLKTRSCLKVKAQMSSKPAPSKLTLLKRMIAQKQQKLRDGKATNNSKTTNNTRTVERLKDLAEEKQLPITLQQQLSSDQQGQPSRGQQKLQLAPLSSPGLRPFPEQISPKDKNRRNNGQLIQLRLPPPTQAQLAAQVPPYPPSHHHKAMGNMLPATVQQQQPQCVHSHPSSSCSIHPHPPRLIQQSSMPQTYQNQMLQSQEQHRNPQQWQQHWQEQQQLQQLQQQHRSQYQQQFSQQQYHQQQQLLRQQQQQQQQQIQPMTQYGETNQYHINRQSLFPPQASPANSYYARIPSSENLSQQQQPITNIRPKAATSSNSSSLQVNSPPFLSLTKSRANSVSALAQAQVPPITRDFSDHLQSPSPSHPSLPVFNKAHSWVGGTDQAFKSHPYGMYPVDDPQQQIHQQQLRLQQQQRLMHQQQGQQQQQYNYQLQQHVQSQQQHQQAQHPQKQSLHQHAPRINPASQFGPNFPETCKLNDNCQLTAQSNSDSSNPLGPNSTSLTIIPSNHQSQQLIQTKGLLVKGRSESLSQMQASTPSTIASKFETSQKLSPLEPTHQLLFSSSSEQQRAELEIADFLLDSTLKGAEEDDEFNDMFAINAKSNPNIVASRKRRNSEEDQADELLCTREDAKFQFNNNTNVFEDTDIQGFHNNSDTYFTSNNNNKISQQHAQPPQEQLPSQDYNFHHGILSRHTLVNSNFFSDIEELHSEDHFFAPFQPS